MKIRMGWLGLVAALAPGALMRGEVAAAAAPATAAVAPSAPAAAEVSGTTAETSGAGAAGAAAAAAASAKAAVTLPLTPRFKQTRARIEALFEHRNETPPVLTPRSNPFRPAGPLPSAPTMVSASGKTEPVATEVLPALALLQQSVANLKVSGTFEIAGTTHLVINARPYKEGDVVPTQANGQAVYLRVRAISRRGVTLTLDGAEMTLSF